MKLRILHLVFLIAIAGIAYSQTTVWNPAGNGITEGTANWNEPANWTQGIPNPGSGKAVFNVPDAVPAVITDAQETFQLVQGDNGDGGQIIVMDGGSLTTGETWSGIGYNAAANLTVETGGVVNYGQHMWIGFLEGSEAIVNITGGAINVAAMTGLGWNGGQASVYLSDGFFNLANINPTELKSVGEGSVIDITGGGVMTIDGNRTAHTVDGEEFPDQIVLFEEEERIVALSGNAGLIYWYDEELDETWIVAPAVVDATSPLDADTDISRDSDIQIVFSKEMDPAAAEASITVSPAIENQAFVWSQTGDTLSITGDLEDGRTYAVSVSTDAVDLFGYNLAYEESFSFTVEGELAVLNVGDVPEGLNVYPNPTRDHFSFGQVAQQIEVVDVTGKVLLRDQNVLKMDVSSLSMGQYYIKALINEKAVTKKLIIQ